MTYLLYAKAPRGKITHRKEKLQKWKRVNSKLETYNPCPVTKTIIGMGSLDFPLAGNYPNVNVLGNVVIQSQLCFTILYYKAGLPVVDCKYKSRYYTN